MDSKGRYRNIDRDIDLFAPIRRLFGKGVEKRYKNSKDFIDSLEGQKLQRDSERKSFWTKFLERK